MGAAQPGAVQANLGLIFGAVAEEAGVGGAGGVSGVAVETGAGATAEYEQSDDGSGGGQADTTGQAQAVEEKQDVEFASDASGGLSDAADAADNDAAADNDDGASGGDGGGDLASALDNSLFASQSGHSADNSNIERGTGERCNEQASSLRNTGIDDSLRNSGCAGLRNSGSDSELVWGLGLALAPPPPGSGHHSSNSQQSSRSKSRSRKRNRSRAGR